VTLRTSAAPSGPVVTSTEVTFRFPDPEARLSGVRLAQQVRIPGNRLGFTRRGGITDWGRVFQLEVDADLYKKARSAKP